MSTATPLNPLEFPMSSTRLIEASAGTGKTYTIAALYVRLILGHGQDNKLPARELLPPDILVVTFTEAATKELRERIRTRLSQAARYFRQQLADGDDFLKPLRDSIEPSLWSACAHRLELAANWMDESSVYTIHGWCNRMLQQHAFDSGSLFRQKVNTDDQELLNEVVRDYWRTFFYPLPEVCCQAVFKLARSPEELTKLLKPLLPETEALGLDCTDDDIAAVFNSWQQWEQKRHELENTTRKVWHDNQQTIATLLNDASDNRWLNGVKYNPKTFSNKLAELAAWAQFGDNMDIEALAKFGQTKLHAGLVKAHQDKAEQIQHDAFLAIDNLVSHAQQELDISEKLILHAIQWIRQRYDTEKQRAARMTFDDMLTRLDNALQGSNGERLATAIRQQYPIALIDEFQDTDPVQYRIFSALYPADAETDLGCFMIGDPKQAIYSFRGADIHTYLKAHEATAGRHYTLGTNFRSSQALVQAVNQVFVQADQQAEGAFLFKQGDNNPLPFIAVNAKGRAEQWLVNGESASALTLWHWDSPDPIGMPAYRAELAEVTASEIVRLLNLANQGQTGFKSQSGDIQALQPSDIAILVRTGTEAKIMRNALARRRLRSVYLSERDSIYATGEAADLLIWLKAIAEPRNERKVRAALSTATFGWPYQTLQQLTQDELSWEQQLEHFLGYQQRWQQDGILPTLRQLINDYGLHARLTEANDGERCLTNLLHLAELLQQASGQLDGEQALIRHLAEEIAATDQAAEESVIRLESDANLIKIITIHKSKGLEYPLVFLPFICSFREVSSRYNSFYRYHNADQHLSIDLSKSDETKLVSDKERLQEDLRLLYVAITRARYACWLGVAAIKVGNTKDSQLDKSAIGYLLDWQPKTPATALGDHLAQLKGGCADISIAKLPEPGFDLYRPKQQLEQLDATCIASTKIAENWWIASYSALQTDNKQQVQSTAADTAHDDKQTDEADSYLGPVATLSGIHSLPRGAGPGVLIHELLEKAAYFGFQTVQSAPEPLVNKIFSHTSWDDKRAIIAETLTKWLEMPLLEGADVTLADLGNGQYQAELEFMLGANDVDVHAMDQLITQHTFGGKPRPRLLATQVNGLLKGFIDLVFVHNQQYYVADYKFNALGNNDAAYTTEALETAMLSKRYDVQFALYLLALHRLLKVRLGASYDYDTHIGGGLYLFLRGWQGPTGGRVFNKPPRTMIEAMDNLFAGNGANA
ncbi:MAG: exodeoxyribonuclease V subunit beta [Methylococcaceae bacterium]|nr:exodeoxyribonuclease V subunit beta [Methylococcaceae bacterium]MDZ4157790.1 exodeoxyribonuclease V subunit beta [Methylococcales bacterium]MDP2392134.1 exodeoxyribonuclease V subunit beta [Methylococcaceae bacterium]MDP3020814.1 exodeoxyribonuclease V subunit beta [Methylococcaceae bacterium]MDP3391632.1 exodeoxyribonuclease V subunit beta [Methylococcaceae bacterium]